MDDIAPAQGMRLLQQQSKKYRDKAHVIIIAAVMLKLVKNDKSYATYRPWHPI